jgi:hypothetical protein
VFVVAHFGHWLIGLLQFAPVLAFIGWLVYSQVKDRRAERREKESEGPRGEAAVR